MGRPYINPANELCLDDVTLKEVRRFMDKIEEVDGHWLWVGRKDENGYGSFDYRGQHVGAHRFSHALFKGIVRKLRHVHHEEKCRLHSCIRPCCLKPLTPKANGKDGAHKRWHEPKLFT